MIFGGILNKESCLVIGGYLIWELIKYWFDIFFLSCVGINNQGIYYVYEEDIVMKQVVREKSNKIVLLCDYIKINLLYNYFVYLFEEIDYLIIDKKIFEELVVRIGKSKIIYIKENSYD